MERNNTQLIVVLGMHRSGTSAITRGLQVLGVQLGNRLLPAVENDNNKGYWEDTDVNDLNIEMMQEIKIDWDYIAPITSKDVEMLCKKGYKLRAIELLRKKVGDDKIFGLKDPRIAKLLPFWKVVFDQCGFDMSYILALRHPFSVAKSLSKRGFKETDRSYYLWLEYVISSLTHTQNELSIVVDYDRLMQSPKKEIGRVSKQLNLKLNQSEMQQYLAGFLDNTLRHTVYTIDDLLVNHNIPPLLKEIYTALLDAASDKVEVSNVKFRSQVEKWEEEFIRLSPTLKMAENLTQALEEREKENASFTQLNVERDVHIKNLTQALEERDNIIHGMVSSVTWRITRPFRLVKNYLSSKGDMKNV